MKIIEGLNFDYSLFYNLIEDGSKVLFLSPVSINYVLKFIEEKNCICEVFEDRFEKIEEATKLNIEVKFGSLNRDLISIEKNSFDYIISDELINEIKFPIQFLKNLNQIAKKIIFTFNNIASIKKRINFLFSGSIFNSKYNSNEVFWDNQKPWPYSYKDIRSLISCANLMISKGIYLDSKQIIHNIYDIRGYPNLFGKKFFFIIELQDGIVLPKYVI